MTDKITSNVSTELDKLRDLLQNSVISRSEVWDEKDKGSWSKLWSAVDNIEDTQAAIEQFKEGKTGFIGYYGVLQALVVQQDAVRHLRQSLGQGNIQWREYPNLSQIRLIRVETIGHPTDTKTNSNNSDYEEGTISYSSISKNSSSPTSFEYVVWSKNGNEIKKINLLETINEQNNDLSTIIKDISEAVSVKEKDHKSKFYSDRLALLFDQLPYHASKLYERERNKPITVINLRLICKKYNDFKNGVKKRYGEKVFDDDIMIPGTKLLVDKIDKQLPRVIKMVNGSASLDETEYEVYIDALRNELLELADHAKEIDAVFSEDAKE